MRGTPGTAACGTRPWLLGSASSLLFSLPSCPPSPSLPHLLPSLPPLLSHEGPPGLQTPHPGAQTAPRAAGRSALWVAGIALAAPSPHILVFLRMSLCLTHGVLSVTSPQLRPSTQRRSVNVCSRRNKRGNECVTGRLEKKRCRRPLLALRPSWPSWGPRREPRLQTGQCQSQRGMPPPHPASLRDQFTRGTAPSGPGLAKGSQSGLWFGAPLQPQASGGSLTGRCTCVWATAESLPFPGRPGAG